MKFFIQRIFMIIMFTSFSGILMIAQPQFQMESHLSEQGFIKDFDGKTLDGLLCPQVHVGPPTKVEYRNILLKKL